MEWVETTGRSIEEAKEAALDLLGVDESEAEFDVLEEARLGLFGRLRSEARVRARVRPTVPRSKDDRRDRRRRNRGASQSEVRETGADSVGTGSGTPGDSATLTVEDAGAAAPEPAAGAAAAGAAAGGPGDGTRTGGTRRSSSHQQRRGRRPGDSAPEVRGRARRPAADGTSTGAEGTGDGATADSATAGRDARWDDTGGAGDRGSGERAEGAEVEVALEEQGRVAEDFLTQLVSELGLTPRLTLHRPDDDTVELRLTGDDLGLLIGPKGATLLAIQDLTRTVVHHRTGATNGRIQVDVGGYRQKRTEALVRFAHQVASTVRQTGARTALEPMTAADRKIVHDAITEIDGVTTVSEGEEPNRRVVVVPAES